MFLDMEETDNIFPHSGYELYFEIDYNKVSTKQNMFYGKCKLCNKTLSVSKISAQNLNKHIQVS